MTWLLGVALCIGEWAGLENGGPRRKSYLGLAYFEWHRGLGQVRFGTIPYQMTDFGRSVAT